MGFRSSDSRQVREGPLRKERRFQGCCSHEAGASDNASAARGRRGSRAHKRSCMARYERRSSRSGMSGNTIGVAIARHVP